MDNRIFKLPAATKFLLGVALFILLIGVEPIAESAFAPSAPGGNLSQKGEDWTPEATLGEPAEILRAGLLPVTTVEPVPLAIITPRAQSYTYTASPVFEVQTGANTHFRLELTLAKHFFDPDFGERITSAADVDQNFYTGGITPRTGETTLFTVPNDIWRNLRGSRVFYRVITYANAQGTSPLYSTTDANWAQAPSINRTNEGWYGLPLNDQAQIGGTNVVVNNELNTRAVSSDYGPRNVTDGSRFHPGLDIPVARNTPVYAFNTGTVVRDGTGDEHRVDIDHGGYRSGYVHLEYAVVSAGEQVRTGQLIGYSGDHHNGRSYTNFADHLHFDSGYDNAQIYDNPLHLLRYIDEHTLSNDNQTYLGDGHTNRRQIDVVRATNVVHHAVVGFGVTTNFDKDLNSVAVQVDGSDDAGQSFLLDYDEVTTQNSSTGVVTLSNGTQFQIFQPGANVYTLASFDYPFYVKAETTNVNLVAKDYFYFPWNTAPFANDLYAGPHRIRISLEEVDGVPVTREITIGPEISVTNVAFNGSTVNFEFTIINHDVQTGDIDLQLINLPDGWTGQLSQSRVSLPANDQATVTLTLTAPGEASAQPLIDNLTSVIATFARIPDLKDGRVLCEAGGGGGAQFYAKAASSAGECGVSVKVKIEDPANGETVVANSTETVKVWAEFGATNVRLTVNGVEQPLDSSDNLNAHYFRWLVPDQPGSTFNLQSFASLNGIEYKSSVVPVTVIEEPPIGEVNIEFPANGDSVTPGQPVSVVASAPEQAERVELRADPPDSDFGGWMWKDDLTGKWKLDWTPTVGSCAIYTLTVTAYDVDWFQLGEDSVQVTSVYSGSCDPSAVQITFPQNDDVLFARRAYAISVTADFPTRYFELKLTDELGNVQISKRTYDPPESQPLFAGWRPEVGTYTLEVTAWNHPSRKVTSDIVKVTVIDPGIEIPINEHAFLYRIPQLRGTSQNGYLKGTIKFNTGVPTSDYVCGVVGFYAYGGDIDESHGNIEHAFQINMRYTEGPWYVYADFLTEPAEEENWDVDLLCISTSIAAVGDEQEGKPIFLEQVYRQGDNLDIDTGHPTDKYACGLAGYDTGPADINEKGDGTIIQAYLYRKSGTWHLRADLRTHSNGDENWSGYLLCISRELAALDGPVPNKAYFFMELEGLGDNLGPKNPYDTRIPSDDYVCGIVGFAARDGDLDEGEKSSSSNLISVAAYEANSSWHLRADFRSHKDDESWDVNLLCILKTQGDPFPWNDSRQEDHTGSCMSDSSHCQVLRDESINLTGQVYVLGGGITGDPSYTGLRCNSPDQIEVYVNDRDPGTGKPLWSWPDFCVKDGDLLFISEHNVYDLKGVSVEGATTKGFSLRSPASPPLLTTAYPKLFPDDYGPGMRLEWEPTLHPQAAYYEIQFSEDGGSTWHVYNSSREISHGGWINHHSNLHCGFGFTKCLKRTQEYTYRLRVLDSAKNPLTAWSNTLTATSLEWPAHVNLATPGPPGPYPPVAEVFLSLEDTYGQGLQLEWNIVPWAGAEYEIISGCENGSLGNASASTCKLHIRRGDLELSASDQAKLASLIPETSVDVIVTGRDSFGYSASDKIVLSFTNSCPGIGCEPD